ncbi:hypothetical protein MLD38_027859 [Melastoma candidum]|uniref:Uncharacterized protein n=1 Tax=Melastoma candidum TaxID=119954 RepID=A0ACB9MZ51_9MYRT|nr:hypothetical protein MLD38_027859 [Melastoma candidum]
MDEVSEFDMAFPHLGGSAGNTQVSANINGRSKGPVVGNNGSKEGVSFKSALNAWGSTERTQHTVAFNENGKLKVPAEWKEGAKSKWGSCIVGFMIGKHVDPAVIRRLTGIPLELWHKEGILYLASVLGAPIKVDGRSERPANMGTARVQVNCAAVNELRKTIEIEGEEGEGIQVEVFYENITLQCQHCKVFGHTTG